MELLTVAAVFLGYAIVAYALVVKAFSKSIEDEE